jgi:hypothetical protein
MQHVIAWSILLVASAVLVGCVDPTGITPRGVRDPTFVVESARRSKPPQPVPDSVGAPPLPVPPIYEEVPLLLYVRQ